MGGEIAAYLETDLDWPISLQGRFQDYEQQWQEQDIPQRNPPVDKLAYLETRHARA